MTERQDVLAENPLAEALRANDISPYVKGTGAELRFETGFAAALAARGYALVRSGSDRRGAGMTTTWAVVYGNYDPPEVKATFWTETEAEAEADRLNDTSEPGMWRVIPQSIRGDGPVVREEWRDHIPSGYEDQSGYGQVSCSCGWDSGGKVGWEAHIDAAERMGRAIG